MAPIQDPIVQRTRDRPIRCLGAGTALLVALLAGHAATADTLDDVRRRGVLRCGIQDNSPGFSTVDAQGTRRGYTIDQCHVVAVAIFGAIRAQYAVITPQAALLSLQTGRVDILSAGATWAFRRDTSLGLDHAGANLYIGQGFPVRADAGVRTVADLDGATIRVVQGTTAELDLADHFGARRWFYTPSLSPRSITLCARTSGSVAMRSRPSGFHWPGGCASRVGRTSIASSPR